MRRLVAAAGILSAVLAGVSLTSVTPAASGQPATFIIPGSDGYGIADCLSSGNECGKVVADGWCEANGYGHAETFGPVSKEDITGSISTAPARPSAKDTPLSITCAE